ncbi:hypothetical protein F9802_10590 [Bacillus aerolatus]|uniref:DUF481 domain-containing protein n=1 Tax=Bacillus aerolatus TaxID=2653354 RepID=A0A6I1FFB6_9BACI|nr:hypothetical protein [Bacillus aerolatus]KAB7706635.1 hypothetical protein F9802_10590 [Bacillus aerolatus]
MNNQVKKFAIFFFTAILVLSAAVSFPAAKAEAAVIWDGVELKKGTIGKVTILKDTPLFTRSKGKIVKVKTLKKGQTASVFAVTEGYYHLYKKTFIKKNSYAKFTAVPKDVQYELNKEFRTVYYGLKLNKKHKYTYYDAENDLENWEYSGASYGWEVWKVNGANGYAYTENKNWMRLGVANSDFIFLNIKLPLKTGSYWRDDIYGIHHRVLSVNKTVKTPAGTFKHVIEIKDSENFYYYFAPNVGLILTVDNNGKTPKRVFELRNIQ